MNLALKYVALRAHATDEVTFVFGLAPLSHQDLLEAFARTHAAISAGFVEPMANGQWRTFGYSQSLCLTPNATDAALITAFTRAQFATSPRATREDEPRHSGAAATAGAAAA